MALIGKKSALQEVAHDSDYACRALWPVSWKYNSIAYSLILKNVGVLIQTLYLMATDMGLGGCAIGTPILTGLQR